MLLGDGNLNIKILAEMCQVIQEDFVLDLQSSYISLQLRQKIIVIGTALTFNEVSSQCQQDTWNHSLPEQQKVLDYIGNGNFISIHPFKFPTF